IAGGGRAPEAAHGRAGRSGRPGVSDTFFTAAPHWAWLVVAYFFIGGVAGGACFLSAVLAWLGRPEDGPVVRTGFRVGFAGAMASGLLLTMDLGRPERFWHMLFQSDRLPALMFKSWSPMSFGAWALLLFGLFTGLAARGARARLVTGLAAFFGLFMAGYTGVLL